MLYLVLLSYCRPLAEIEPHLAEHRAFLKRHYQAGHFLLSGPQQPRTGGVILATAGSREELRQWLAEDPFERFKVATFEIIAWSPTMQAIDLAERFAALADSAG